MAPATDSEDAYREIENLTTEFDLPQTVESLACLIIDQWEDDDQFVDYSSSTYGVGAVVAAAKQEGLPDSAEMIEDAAEHAIADVDTTAVDEIQQLVLNRQKEIAVAEIDHLGDELTLPDTVQNLARVIITQWDDLNYLQTRSLIANAAAAVVVAAKVEQLPYTIRDVAAETRVEVTTRMIGRAETDMMTTLDHISDVRPPTPSDYVDRYADEAAVRDSIRERTYTVLERATDGDPTVFSGRSPSAAAGAALWIASRLEGRELTQNTVSDLAETSDVTIRSIANSILVAIIKGGDEIEAYATTDTLDSRLRMRVRRATRDAYVEIYADRVGLARDVCDCVQDDIFPTAKKTDQTVLTTGSPAIIAAASIWIAARLHGDGVAHHDMAEIANIRETDLLNKIDELVEAILAEVDSLESLATTTELDRQLAGRIEALESHPSTSNA